MLVTRYDEFMADTISQLPPAIDVTPENLHSIFKDAPIGISESPELNITRLVQISRETITVVGVFPLVIRYIGGHAAPNKTRLEFTPALAQANSPGYYSNARWLIEKHTELKPVEVDVPETIVSLPTPPWITASTANNPRLCFESEYDSIIKNWIAALKLG